VSVETKPRVLIVDHTYTNQSGRVADAIAQEFEARGCEVTKAMIELTDQRWVPKLFSQFPLKHPIAQISSMLTAQLRHQTGEIRVPAEAEEGDYDLVVIASPTWWIQTSMPIRSYLQSPAARVILNGKPFATVSISRRYYGINLGQQRKLAEKNGGRFTDKTHFVAAGGQVKSMLSWLGYMKHGEPQERVMGLKMPAPNLKPDFEEQAKTFADGLVDRVLQPVAAGTGE
jgi:menaquinone-dependent protoporphyrinogen IX oxidase